MPLTPKQERFVAEYLVDLNATQAAIRAGYSSASAYSQAHDLLKKPEIASAVQERKSAIVAAADDSAADVLRDTIATYKAALAAEQYGPAVSALNLRAKRHPEFSEKHDIEAKVGVLLMRQTRGLNGG